MPLLSIWGTCWCSSLSVETELVPAVLGQFVLWLSRFGAEGAWSSKAPGGGHGSREGLMEGMSLCSWSLREMVPGLRKPWLRLAPQAALLQSSSEPGPPSLGG